MKIGGNMNGRRFKHFHHNVVAHESRMNIAPIFRFAKHEVSVCRLHSAFLYGVT